MVETKLTYGGQLEGFPAKVVFKMLEYQELQENPRDVTVFEKKVTADADDGGFNWDTTFEGSNFWDKVIHYHDFTLFNKKYPADGEAAAVPVELLIEMTNEQVLQGNRPDYHVFETCLKMSRSSGGINWGGCKFNYEDYLSCGHPNDFYKSNYGHNIDFLYCSNFQSYGSLPKTPYGIDAHRMPPALNWFIIHKYPSCVKYCGIVDNFSDIPDVCHDNCNDFCIIKGTYDIGYIGIDGTTCCHRTSQREKEIISGISPIGVEDYEDYAEEEMIQATVLLHNSIDKICISGTINYKGEFDVDDNPSVVDSLKQGDYWLQTKAAVSSFGNVIGAGEYAICTSPGIYEKITEKELKDKMEENCSSLMASKYLPDDAIDFRDTTTLKIGENIFAANNNNTITDGDDICVSKTLLEDTVDKILDKRVPQVPKTEVLGRKARKITF